MHKTCPIRAKNTLRAHTLINDTSSHKRRGLHCDVPRLHGFCVGGISLKTSITETHPSGLLKGFIFSYEMTLTIMECCIKYKSRGKLHSQRFISTLLNGAQWGSHYVSRSRIPMKVYPTGADTCLLCFPGQGSFI